MIRQAACQSVIIYIFIKIPVTSFYTHSFNSRVFFRFNPKPEKKSIKESVFISSVAQQEVNIHLPLKCKNNSGWWWNKDIWIKPKTSTYASSQPDVHGSSRGGREQRGRDETAATRKGNPFCSWHMCQTFWRLWNGSRPRPDPSRNRASGVARAKTCIWKMEKEKRLSHQKCVPNPNLFSQQWIRKESSGQIQFIDIGFHVSPLKKASFGWRHSK